MEKFLTLTGKIMITIIASLALVSTMCVAYLISVVYIAYETIVNKAKSSELFKELNGLMGQEINRSIKHFETLWG